MVSRRSIDYKHEYPLLHAEYSKYDHKCKWNEILAVNSSTKGVQPDISYLELLKELRVSFAHAETVLEHDSLK